MAFTDILNGLFNLNSSPQEAASSAQLQTNTGGASGSWGTPVVTPTVPTNPIVNSNPTPAKTTTTTAPSNSNANPHINPATGQWDDNYYASQQQSSGGGVDYNAIYQPQLDALNAAVGTAQSSAANQEANVNTLAAQQKRDLTDQEASANTAYQKTQDKAQVNLQSALSDAVRAYNALQQQTNARFGGSSSAGAAVGELAQQQYFRETGKTQQSYADVFNNIQDQWHATLKQVASAQLKVDDWVDTNMRDIKTWLGDQLQQISMAKAQTESDKSAQRVAALDRTVQVAQQINSYKQQAQIQLDQWKQQQQYLIENKLAPLYGNQPTSNVYNNGGGQTTIGAGTSSSALPNIRWNPQTQRWEDPYGNVVNQ